jgi:5-methylcytosine-specific restriction endonuclease McrA
MRHCAHCQRLAARQSYWRRRFFALEARARRRAREYGCPWEVLDYSGIIAEELPANCPLCGQPMQSAGDVEFHHMLALALGGAHRRENVRLVHRSCNRAASLRVFILSKTLNRRASA